MSISTTIASASPWAFLRQSFAGEGRAWIFVFKVLLAWYLDAWLAMWLNLESPWSSMVTVAIVMSPQSGTVLAKSFYRAAGTLCGSVFAVLLMGAFPQQRMLFLAGLSVWIGLCAGGATYFRNFLAYGFVLAGFTATIVVIPAISNPQDVFHSAVMRVSEVWLAVLVAGVVTDVVFPDRLMTILLRSTRGQFQRFIDFVRDVMGGRIERKDIADAHVKIVRAAVLLEDQRQSVVFEGPDARARDFHMRLRNQRHMAASTFLQSLHHFLTRERRRGHDATVAALIALYQPLAGSLAPPADSASDPGVLASRVQEYALQMPAQMASLRAGLPSGLEQLAFDAGAQLLRRFVEELQGYVAMELALRNAGPPHRVSERGRFRRGNDPMAAWVAVLRTALTMAALSLFWVATAWPGGPDAILMASVYAGLFAVSSNVLQSVTGIQIGYLTGMAAGFLITFFLLPGSDGMVMFIAATAPLFLIGPWLTTRPGLGFIGPSYSLGVVFTLGLTNPMVYDPVTALSNAIGANVGVAFTAVAFVFLPLVTGSAWQRRQHLRRLREQVAIAASAPLDGLAWQFESTSRDLFHQTIVNTRPDTTESRNLLGWALAVHDIGRTLIELRQALDRMSPAASGRMAVNAAVHAVAALFHRPDVAHRQRAIDATRAAFQACPDESPLRPYLYGLFSALADDASPLATLATPAAEVIHVA